MTVPPDFHLRVLADAGSLPPPYQESVVVTLDARGHGTITEQGGARETVATPVHLGADAIASLYADVVSFGVFTIAWAEPDGPVTPGGPNVWITAARDGDEVSIPSVVADEQREARAAIIQCVEAAIGRSLRL